MSAERGLELSVVVAADRFDAIAELVAALREQSALGRLELVVVTASAARLEFPLDRQSGFGAMQVIEVGDENFAQLYRARAVGVRAAQAPVVVFAETHCFPDPGWAEALIEAHRGDWAGVVPAFTNANPASTISWSNLVIDYGPWLAPGCEGPVSVLPGHNSSFKRDVLVGYGPRLEQLIVQDALLIDDLRAHGHRFYLAPAARVRHLNVDRPASWLLERYVMGRGFAAARAESWSWSHRLVYAAGSPLIPFVRAPRAVRDLRRADQTRELLPKVLPALCVGLCASSLGELLGYALGSSRRAADRMAEIEVRRIDHVRPRSSVAPAANGHAVVSGSAAMETDSGTRPELSVLLAADVFETIREIVGSLADQDRPERLELVVITPSEEGLGWPSEQSGFGAVQIVEVGEEVFTRLNEARACGVRIATAPIVVFGETHSFPEPGWLDALLEAHRGPWAAVGPAIVNGNPESAIGWSALLLDYGPWIERGEPGPRSRIPGHNGAYKRGVLLEYGSRLTELTVSDTLLTDDLVATGRTLYFEPAARTRHVNVSDPRVWIIERFAAGREFASARALDWSRARRLGYAAGSPLIPFVRLYRAIGDMHRIGRVPGLGLRIVPALLVGLGVSAAGECVGYLRGSSEWSHAQLNEIEIHRLRYARGDR